jgi:DNA polymerase
MQVAKPNREKFLADSIIAWWRDAGVDYLCGNDPISWLDDANDIREVAAAPVAGSELSPKTQRHAPSTPASAAPIAWPSDFHDLMAAIASNAALPGNTYGRRIAAPVAVAQPDLMVIYDLPEDADIAAGQLGSGPEGQLLHAIIRACGYLPTQVHITALAHSRPAIGALPPADLPLLAKFARHQISVIRPNRILLLGTAVSEALAGQELMAARSGLPHFNQDGRTMASVATFHPRTLLARPILKAQAWQDLQAIVKKDRP